MATMKFKLLKGKTAYEAAGAANGIAPDGYVNHETQLIKELGDNWVVKVDRVAAKH